jgi:NodT family efflux transporter outer membrane factor (OMF) lipoprotein
MLLKNEFLKNRRVGKFFCRFNNSYFTARVKKLALPIVVILAGLPVTACVVGPDYVSPTTTLPEKWQNPAENQQAINPKELAHWWDAFNDPQLTDLVDRSINGNFDLKIALARITEARARRGVAKADFFPKISFDGGVGENYRGSSDTRNGNYSAGLDATWEIDIFGRIARSVESAQATMEAMEAGYQNVMVSLIAEVGLNYVQMRTLQVRLNVTERNLQTQNHIYQLTQWRWQSGLANKLDVEQALTGVEQLKAQIPALKNQIAQNQHQIALLLGVTPGSLNAQLSNVKDIPVADLKIAVGVPADVLRQRPDIRQAERELAAQTAEIGVATAALYPKLSLSGSIGLEAIKASNFFTAAGLIDSLLGRLTFPIFNAGQIRSNIEVQNAKQEQALASYEATVLTAVKDVENALVAIVQEQERLQNFSRAEQAAQRAFELARNQYAAGLTDFQNVQQTQRTLLNVQDQLKQSQGQQSTNIISLYKALGGGWKSLI